MVASVAIEFRDSGPHEHATRLYEAHSEWLLQYCRRQLGDAADAEDAVQTAFLYAFRALRRGVVPECERAWLTTIARNVCHSQRRTRQRHPDAAERELDRIALAQPDREEAGFLDDVRAALASLPENQRRALVLREWHGVSSNEIATELHLSEPATHALLFRARRSFATAMAAARRPLAGLNVAALLEQVRALVKPLLGGAAAKAAVVTTAAGVVVGGAVLEQRDADAAQSPAARPAAAMPANASVALRPLPREARARARAPSPRAETQGPEHPSTTRSTAPPAAPADDSATRVRRPPTKATEPPTTPAAPPPRSDAPTAPAPPMPVPPAEPPVPAPIDLPPIVGGEPPVELPPPLDELLPPVELPPVDPPPVTVPQLPLP
jgi:RNA polymerase sigma factor (sigma-70 family)